MAKRLLITLAWAQLLIAAIAIVGVFIQPFVELWIKQPIVIAGLISLLLISTVVAPPRIKAPAQQVLNLIFGNPLTSRLIIMLLICASMGGIASIVSRNQYQLPPLWAYLPLIVLWPYLVIALLLLVVDA